MCSFLRESETRLSLLLFFVMYFYCFIYLILLCLPLEIGKKQVKKKHKILPSIIFCLIFFLVSLSNPQAHSPYTTLYPMESVHLISSLYGLFNFFFFVLLFKLFPPTLVECFMLFFLFLSNLKL